MQNSRNELKRGILILFLVHLLPFTGDSGYARTPGLGGYWKFDEGAGNQVEDASGNGNAGTIFGATWVTGRDKYALEFGGDDYVVIPDADALRLHRDFTITVWIKKTGPSVAGKSMGLISKSSDGYWDYDLFMSTSKLEHPAFYSNAFQQEGGDIEVISSKPISLNQWHHVAVTRQDSTARLYVDGEQTGVASLPETLPGSDRELRLGHDHDGGFIGLMDEVRIYNQALDAQEIMEVYASAPLFRQVVVDSAYGGISTVGDIDLDGFPDIVHAYWYDGAPLAWYEYSSITEWRHHIIARNFYPCTDDFEVVDMDGDGDIDIILAMGEGKRSDDKDADNKKIDQVQIIWFENPLPHASPATGTWQINHIGTYSDAAENYNKDIEVADFDGDGNPDVATRANESVSVFLQKNPDEWVRVTHIKIHSHEGMDVGDLDGDGDPDLVLNGYWIETPEDLLAGEWREHNIDSKWWQQTGDWTANNCKVLVQDVNLDGHADVLLSHSERPGFPVSWYEAEDVLNDLWNEHVIGQVDYCHTLQAADFDNDGDIDVFTGEMAKSSDPDEVLLFENSGDSTKWIRRVLGKTSIYSGKVVDIGNDNDIDIIANRNWNQAPLEIWENLLETRK